MRPERILVVDREKTIRNIVKSMLVAAGYQCVQAADCKKALSQLDADEHFDLVLSDDLNGHELLDNTRSKYPDIPVVIIATADDISVPLAAIRSGAFDYLLKPFQREQLLATVRRALENRRLKINNRVRQAKLKDLGYVVTPLERTSPQRILVVDDEEAIRTIVVSMLVTASYECREAESGLDALAILNSGESFDLMLSDLMMANLDGIGLLEKAKEAYPDLPVVMVTAVHDVSVALASIRCGAYDYLLKPFAREQLYATVRRALENRRLTLENRIYETKLEALGCRIESLSDQASLQSPLASTKTELRETLDRPNVLTQTPTLRSPNKDSGQKSRATLLTSLHDLSNEFVIISATIGVLGAQAGNTREVAEEIGTLKVQISKCTLPLRRLLSQYLGVRSARANWRNTHPPASVAGETLRDARHEIKGSFLVIGYSLTTLRDLCNQSKEVLETIENISRSIQRCDELLRQTTPQASEGEKLTTQYLELPAVVEKVISIVKRRMSANVTLTVNCDKSMKRFTTVLQLDRLVSVLVEIITNAVKALQPDGGEIRFSAEKTKNSSVRFVVQDNGPGIPHKIRENLLKRPVPSHSGLGLGLYLSREIIHQFGGDFLVESTAPPKGTRVIILIPSGTRSR